MSRRTIRTSSNPRIVDVSAVEQFAEKHRKETKGTWIYVERPGGFCRWIKRDVPDKVGKELYESTELRLFQSPSSGLLAGVCCDLFVHHFGTRVFVHMAPKVQHQT